MSKAFPNVGFALNQNHVSKMTVMLFLKFLHLTSTPETHIK